jgi:hypothetical protein
MNVLLHEETYAVKDMKVHKSYITSVTVTVTIAWSTPTPPSEGTHARTWWCPRQSTFPASAPARTLRPAVEDTAPIWHRRNPSQTLSIKDPLGPAVEPSCRTEL